MLYSSGTFIPGNIARTQQSLKMSGNRTNNVSLSIGTAHKPRLLILDEDRIILQSLAQFLRREGYAVQRP